MTNDPQSDGNKQKRNMPCRKQQKRLILFTRYPEPGTTKTRLIPALGGEGAAALQKRMTERMLRTAMEFKGTCEVCIEVRFQGGTGSLMKEWLGRDLIYSPQGTGDLGHRLPAAFEEAFREGVHRVVVVGTDCPEMTAGHLLQAFRCLEKTELVLGPAKDGGYYLIGLNKHAPGLFEGVSWGTGTVLKETLALADSLGLTLEMMDVLQDVDRPEDLPLWEKITKSQG